MQYYALSGLGEFDSCTRGDALRACPLAFIFRAFGAGLPIRRTFEAKLWEVHNERFRPERPKYVFALSGLDLNFDSLPGATRFALAPGFYISRHWRCVATFGTKSRRLAACQNLQCSRNPTGLIMAARFLELPGDCPCELFEGLLRSLS